MMNRWILGWFKKKNIAGIVKLRFTGEGAYEGAIDKELSNGWIRGWSRKWNSGEKPKIRVVIDDKWGFDTVSKVLRPELPKSSGNRHIGFEVPVPESYLDGEVHSVKVLLRENLSVLFTRNLRFPSRSSRTDLRVSGETEAIAVLNHGRRIVSGAMRVGPGEAVKAISLNGDTEAGGRPVAGAPFAVTEDRGAFKAFELSLPLDARGKDADRLVVELKSGKTLVAPLSRPLTKVPRVLIVADAEDEKDGSRIFRAQAASIQLGYSGIETAVIDIQTFHKKIAGAIGSYDQYDAILFQRVAFTEIIGRWIYRARSRGVLLLYDVDDRIFKSWKVDDLGSVRSESIRGDNAEMLQRMEERLMLMQFCAATICSTPLLQREVRNMGMRTIVSRNAIEQKFLRNGAYRLLAKHAEQSRSTRFLFMSGTKTHDADFLMMQSALKLVLSRFPEASLTIVGELGEVELDRLDNVVRYPRMVREQLYRLISEHDVTLVPLERTEFNVAKSSLKLIESGAAAVPVIASDHFEFRRDILASGGGIVVRTEQDWFKALMRFCVSEDLSASMGGRLFSYVQENYTNESRKDFLWASIEKVFAEFVEDRRKAKTVGAKLKTPIYNLPAAIEASGL